MNKNIETIRKTREHLVQLVSDVPLDQLNEVPPGFNNNILWNLAHMIAAQQGVCYLRAGLKTLVDEAFYLRFKPDTKPSGYIGADELEQIKTLLFSSLDAFETDFQNERFANYKPWTTRYGVGLANIEEAVQFLLFHEGLHTGYIMALKRAVKR